MDSSSQNQKFPIPLPQEELRSLCWDMGKRFPAQFQYEGIVLLAVYPHLAFLQWHINQDSVDRLLSDHGVSGQPGKLVIRIYDVTDIVFDGFNAHMQFDVDIRTLSGNYYLKADRFERILLAEIGFKCHDGRFAAYSRSNTQYFDRMRRSNRRELQALFVGKKLSAKTAVSNIGCAWIFENMMKALRQAGSDRDIRPAVFVNESPGVSFGSDDKVLTEFVGKVTDKCAELGIECQLFSCDDNNFAANSGVSLDDLISQSSQSLIQKFKDKHASHPFSCIQCHDWYSLPAALATSRESGLPLFYVIHSTGYLPDDDSDKSSLRNQITHWENEALSMIKQAIIPHGAIRDTVSRRLQISSDQIQIIPDNLPAMPARARKEPEGIRERYHLEAGKQLCLFAGEIAHHTGADLLMEVVPGVCSEFPNAQFVFAGEGPLRGELEFRANNAGIGNRCRFIGDIASEYFNQLLSICDFVIIPGRTQQDSSLVQAAFNAGKRVLATHQAGVQGINHGVNGLLVYDNPGSIVWGLKEMFGNPPGAGPIPNSAGGFDKSIECIAARYITLWASAAGRKNNG